MLSTLERPQILQNLEQLQVIRWKFMTLQKVKVNITNYLSQLLKQISPSRNFQYSSHLKP